MTKQINYQTICTKVLSNLPQRQKEVIERRFGLASGQKETLQKIGDDLGITRERVRQIEAEAFSRLKRQAEPQLKPIFAYFSQYLKEAGDLQKEDILLRDLGKERFQNHVYFLLSLGDAFYRFPETDDLFSFWSSQSNICQKLEGVLAKLLEAFKSQNKPLPEEEVIGTCQEPVEQFLHVSLAVSKRIERGPLGEFGLIDWPEIKPRGVKDAAYLTLKSMGKPLHFRELAQAANSLVTRFPQPREILPQTMHNELIKDERFVLVGRGTYALKEWGYLPGTVKEVIAAVLKQARRPLKREEILAKVQKQRLVKENTIFLNLSDRDYFAKDEQQRYTLVV